MRETVQLLSSMTINSLIVLLSQFWTSCPRSGSNCCFLTCIQVSQELGKVLCIPISKNFPEFVVIHTVKDFSLLGNPEVDVFLELSCFFYDPADIGNLICGSSAFSKPSLYIWNFLVHILPKPSLKDFEHNIASMWSAIVCQFVHSLAFPLFGIGMKTDLFPSCGHCWVFQICCHIECSTITVSSFRDTGHLTLYKYPITQS